MTKCREGDIVMSNGFMSFTKIKPDVELLDAIWTIDPRRIDHMDGAELSSYALALSQYLIFFTYQRNLTRAEATRLNRYIDRRVSMVLSSPGEAKKYKTKAAAIDCIIPTDEELMLAQAKLDDISMELIHTEGIEKAISELIATIKRELTRRDNELYQHKMDRRL